MKKEKMEKKLTIRIKDNVYQKLEQEAKDSDQKISQLIRDLVEEAFKHREKEPVVIEYRYKKIFDDYLGYEDIWQFGITDSGEELKIGPFVKEDIHSLIEQLPDILSSKELEELTKILSVGFERIRMREGKQAQFLERKKKLSKKGFSKEKEVEK